MIGRCNNNVGLPRLVTWEEGDWSVTSNQIFKLVRAIGEYRDKHGGDLAAGWEDRIGDAVCEMPGMSRVCVAKADPPDYRKVNLSDIGNFLSVVSAWLARGGEIVPSEESTRRASICSTCPMNVPIRGCMGCHNALPAIMKAAQGATTPHDSVLQGCAVCGCALRAKVHLPEEVMDVHEDRVGDFPSHCWLVTQA